MTDKKQEFNDRILEVTERCAKLIEGEDPPWAEGIDDVTKECMQMRLVLLRHSVAGEFNSDDLREVLQNFAILDRLMADVVRSRSLNALRDR